MSIKKIFSLLWQEQCVGCKTNSPLNDYGFCSACQRKIISVENALGTGIIHILRYEGPVRDAICNFKYGGKKYCGKKFALLASDFIRKNDIPDFDAIIAVPLHWKKEFRRGFNQSAVIASYIARILCKQYLPGVLYRKRNTLSQTELSEEERKKNVTGVFRIRSARLIESRKILLVDDVYTSGATAREARKTLMIGGAKKVTILTIAKA